MRPIDFPAQLGGERGVESLELVAELFGLLAVAPGQIGQGEVKMGLRIFGLKAHDAVEQVACGGVMAHFVERHAEMGVSFGIFRKKLHGAL